MVSYYDSDGFYSLDYMETTTGGSHMTSSGLIPCKNDSPTVIKIIISNLYMSLRTDTYTWQGKTKVEQEDKQRKNKARKREGTEEKQR